MVLKNELLRRYSSWRDIAIFAAMSTLAAEEAEAMACHDGIAMAARYMARSPYAGSSVVADKLAE